MIMPVIRINFPTCGFCRHVPQHRIINELCFGSWLENNGHYFELQTNVATRSRVERVLFGLEVLPNSATARLQTASLKRSS